MPFTKDELERIADQANRWSIEKHGVPYLEHADRVAQFLGICAQDGRRTRPTTTDTDPPEPRGD